jgi:putative SOS response-associated peptidase YedK
MCGRFAFYSPAEATAALFGVSANADFRPRYNIAPTQDIAAIRRNDEGSGELALFHWGLIPFWAKEPSIGNRMINARAETVAEKPSFRTAYKKRRSLILANGFYEWKKSGNVKTPWFISTADGSPFAFAGLWEDWLDKESGESIQSTTIVTTAANEFISSLHNRMPVILEPRSAERWLGGDNELLAEYAASDKLCPPLQAWPVARVVNKASNEGAGLIEPDGDVIQA